MKVNLKTMEERVEDADLEEKLQLLERIDEFGDQTTASKIFDEQIDYYKGDYSACIDILQLYAEKAVQGVYKHLPLLKRVIFRVMRTTILFLKWPM